MHQLQLWDYIVFLIYFLIVAFYGYWIYNRKKKAQSDSKDFFLAEGALTWWAIGASLIASNISAEQFIGMSGSGFKMGLAIATYEWMAAATLLVVAIFFMPIYLKNHIYTMPQFLTQRYNTTVSTIMAVFWLLLYVIVNLTSILFLGALAISTISGLPLMGCMVGLGVFAILITLGGMKVIGYTDVILVFFLTARGLATTYLALQLVSEHYETTGIVKGFSIMVERASDHFTMVFDRENPNYLDLPGLTILLGGMWIVNLNYWGCNQYITQRALGASLPTARAGIFFAAFLKLMMPVLVVLPGIAAYVLHQNGELQQQMLVGGEFREDNAYSAILGFLPAGLKGLSLAALTAAIVASLAGKANSIATIYTLDIYKKYFQKTDSEKQLVWVGRVVIVVALVIAIAMTWKDTLGIGGKGGFEFIQKYTGYISPAIFPVFLLGFFWKRTTSTAAIAGILGGVTLSALFDNAFPKWFGPDTLLYTAYPNANGVYEIPFLISMGWVFFFTTVIMVLVSLLGKRDAAHGLAVDRSMFRLSPKQLATVLILLGLIGALYLRFW